MSWSAAELKQVPEIHGSVLSAWLMFSRSEARLCTVVLDSGSGGKSH